MKDDAKPIEQLTRICWVAKLIGKTEEKCFGLFEVSLKFVCYLEKFERFCVLVCVCLG